MKKLITIFSLTLLFISCDKEHDDENECPTLTREQVPTTVIDNFDSRYIDASEIVWFDKDGQAFCAIFDNNGQELEVTFDLEGNFISEEVEMDNEQEGNHEDENEEGCECEREDEDDE